MLEAQTSCLDTTFIKEEIQQRWEQVKIGTQVKTGTSDLVTLCQEIDSFARICPYQFADYIVAANARASMSFSEDDEVIKYLQKGEKALFEYESHLSFDLILRTKFAIHFERCRLTDSQGDLMEAIRCYEQTYKELPKQHADSFLQAFQYAFPFSIARLYLETGNHKESLRWLRNAELHLNNEHQLYPGVFYNLRGRVNKALGKYDQAEINFQKALEVFNGSVRGKKSNHIIENYVNFAELLVELSRPLEALNLLEEANRNEQISPRGEFMIHYQLSKVYLSTDRFALSLAHGQTALQYVEAIKTGPYYWKGRIIQIISEVLIAQQQWEIALDSIQSAMKHLSVQFTALGWDENPDVLLSHTKLDLLKLLVLKAKTLEQYAQEQGDHSPHLDWALATYSEGIKLIQVLRAEYQDDEVKEYLSEQSFPIFENALNVAYRLFNQTQKENYLNAAFAIMETSKSLSLLERLKEIEAKKYVGLPQRQIDLESRLKIKIAREELKIIEKEKTNHLLGSQYDSLFHYRKLYHDLISNFKQKNPNYYNLKYNTSPIKVSKLKQLIATDESFIEYFYGEKMMYIFSISGSETKLTAFELNHHFVNSLDTFVQIVRSRKGVNSGKKIQRFLRTGHLLYCVLIQQLNLKGNKLIIVPDGPLNHLPFVSLPMNTDFSEELSALPYMIQNYIVRNNFSASVLNQQYQNQKYKDKQSESLLVIAPKTFPNHSNLSFDSTGLVPVFNDRIQIERAPSKKKLFKLLEKGYQNVLFFSHASLGRLEPYLQLSNDTLYLREIYATPISANLILLGACETGLGIGVKGEGVHSLARGFAYQGVPNIIMTLWKVQQASTSTFLKDLLRYHILENFSLPQAMRKVQMNTLNQEETSEPFHWAGFVIMGG